MTGNRQVREGSQKTSNRLCECHEGEGGEEVPPSEPNLPLGTCSLETACKQLSAEHTPEGVVFSFPLHILDFVFLGIETMRNGITPSCNDLNQSVHCRQGSLTSIAPLSASSHSLFSPKELSSALNRTVMKYLRGTGRSCETLAHAKQDRRAEGRGPGWLCRARPTQLEPLPPGGQPGRLVRSWWLERWAEWQWLWRAL